MGAKTRADMTAWITLKARLVKWGINDVGGQAILATYLRTQPSQVYRWMIPSHSHFSREPSYSVGKNIEKFLGAEIKVPVKITPTSQLRDIAKSLNEFSMPQVVDIFLKQNPNTALSRRHVSNLFKTMLYRSDFVFVRKEKHNIYKKKSA